MDWLGFTLARMALQRGGGGLWKTVLVLAALVGLCIALLLALLIGWLFWNWLSAWKLWDLALWGWLAEWWQDWWGHYPSGWRWWMALPVTLAWVILCWVNGICASEAVYMARFRSESLRLNRWAEKGRAAMAEARREGRGPVGELLVNDPTAYKDEAIARDAAAHAEASRKHASRMVRATPYAYVGGGLLAIFTGFLSSPLHGWVREAVLSYQAEEALLIELMGESVIQYGHEPER